MEEVGGVSRIFLRLCVPAPWIYIRAHVAECSGTAQRFYITLCYYFACEKCMSMNNLDFGAGLADIPLYCSVYMCVKCMHIYYLDFGARLADVLLSLCAVGTQYDTLGLLGPMAPASRRIYTCGGF